ncbi:MAG: Lrp/AsnC family transcriptional regulator [Tepidamorphaceae bacterium]|nr:Lrp/AsnC family transcriptional regulator [Rhodobiaceae bacterium]
MPSLDSHDRRILEEVQRDASLSIQDLADRISLSRNATWRRLQRLEEDGYVRGRVALLDRDRLGLGLMVMIAIRTDTHSAGWLKKFHEAVRTIPEITGVYRMTGDVDYLLQAVVPDMAAYDRLYKTLIGRIDLSDVSSSFVMEEIKATTCLPLGYV